jgi:hypothetical protein
MNVPNQMILDRNLSRTKKITSTKKPSPVLSIIEAKSGLNVQKYENDDRKISHGQYNLSLSLSLFFSLFPFSFFCHSFTDFHLSVSS